MNIEKLKQMAFAEGTVEDFIEHSVESVETDSVNQAAKLSTAWQILSNGLKELREENLELSGKLERAKALLGEHLLQSDR